MSDEIIGTGSVIKIRSITVLDEAGEFADHVSKLLIVSSEFPPGPGGIGTHAHLLALELQQLGWEIVVISRQDYAQPEEISKFNARQPFHIEYLSPVRTLPLELFYRGVVVQRWISRWKPDVILASGMRSVWLTAVLARTNRVPFVSVGHGTEFLLGRVYERRLTRWAYSQSTRVICVSQYTHQTMLRAKIHPRHATVIHNGADEHQFFPLPAAEVEQQRAALDFENTRLLITVGNVTERKGQDIVIRALPSILRAYPDVHYLIVGLPSCERQFREIAVALGVEEHVHFLGRVTAEALVTFLNISDVFVMTSRRTPEGDVEGYGIAVVEAALCGKPAVVAADSGLAEAIIAGHTGFIVPPNDPDATAECITRLLSDDALRREMGHNARIRALHEQTWTHRATEYHNLLISLIGQQPSTAT